MTTREYHIIMNKMLELEMLRGDKQPKSPGNYLCIVLQTAPNANARYIWEIVSYHHGEWWPKQGTDYGSHSVVMWWSGLSDAGLVNVVLNRLEVENKDKVV